MIRLFVIALLTSPICSKPGFRSSVMYGEKPILRMGQDSDSDDESSINGDKFQMHWKKDWPKDWPKDWKKDWKKDLKKDLEKDWNKTLDKLKKKLEGSGAKLNYTIIYSPDSHGIKDRKALDSFTKAVEASKSFKDLENALEKLKKTGKASGTKLNYSISQIPSSKSSNSWETNLKSYIKETVAIYGDAHLNDYIRPVIRDIEQTHHVIIKDIDGEVSIKYVGSQETKYPKHGKHKGKHKHKHYSGYNDQYVKPKYTLGPEL